MIFFFSLIFFTVILCQNIKTILEKMLSLVAMATSMSSWEMLRLTDQYNVNISDTMANQRKFRICLQFRGRSLD